MPSLTKHLARLHLEELESRHLLAATGWGSAVLLPPAPMFPAPMAAAPARPAFDQVNHLGWDAPHAGAAQTTAFRDARYGAIDQAANDFTPARAACFTDPAWMDRLAVRDTTALLPAEQDPAPRQDRDAVLTAVAVALGGFWSVQVEGQSSDAHRRQGFIRP